MAPYIPSDHRQDIRYAAAGLKRQVEEWQAHGPPPSNYYTARGHGGKYQIYSDHSVSDAATTVVQGATKNHPCSNAGAKDNPTFLPELTFERDQSIGFFDPPIQYMPPQMKWNYHPEGWEFALAEEFRKKGSNVTGSQVKSQYRTLIQDPSNTKEQNYVLHHPSDRVTAVFKGEAAASLVARLAVKGRPYSLIIVCPLVRADGIGWERIWDTKNRPPIYARWSTGEQGFQNLLVLMCIPKPESFKGREAYHKDVYWFSMIPTPKLPFESQWAETWKTFNEASFKILRQSLGVRNEKFTPFFWTIAMLHRRIVLGDRITEKDLGSWIWQFNDHLWKCGSPHDPSKHTFKFNDSLPYKGRMVTFNDLTAWTLNPNFSYRNMIKPMTDRWDAAINALIAYNLDRNDTTWSTFRDLMIKARTPTW